MDQEFYGQVDWEKWTASFFRASREDGFEAAFVKAVFQSNGGQNFTGFGLDHCMFDRKGLQSGSDYVRLFGQTEDGNDGEDGLKGCDKVRNHQCDDAKAGHSNCKAPHDLPGELEEAIIHPARDHNAKCCDWQLGRDQLPSMFGYGCLRDPITWTMGEDPTGVGPKTNTQDPAKLQRGSIP
ncbi:hypothetical protein AYL99_03159 [Fonsecaea erecta]|uniref:Uncharacterized protein n=1 Tax=Fonsecaea erecta TaxID=1367422 RepID=A0A178ZW43_9EURO|nr:hypothetical protein AYL99_03159 [Fonsecaea erecta]OAP63932.1 hypothetical protein AYL99_03159 [Fonsecaea erecta]